ncbi:MAG: VOC family protein [Gemmatimonadota bacterium]|nr:VOC family protein [Gemmatimonadota bacterium]
MQTPTAAATGTEMTTPQFELTQIGQIAINVRDLQRAVAFYRDTLGMRFLFQAPGGLAFFDVGGVRLMLGVAEKPEFSHPASVLYYNVPDIGAAYETLSGRGVTFLDEPHLIARMPDHELWMTFFRDSEENVLALMEERRS